MPKRKYADRRDWARILKSRYAQETIHSDAFDGTVALFYIDAVRAPLVKVHRDEPFTVADEGFAWLQYFPSNEPFGVTVMFDASGEIVQWYIDLVEQIGDDEGVPYMDDLLLDIIVFPDGDLVKKDEDEFADAAERGDLTPELIARGRRDFEATIRRIERHDFVYFDLAKQHYKQLKEKL